MEDEGFRRSLMTAALSNPASSDIYSRQYAAFVVVLLYSRRRTLDVELLEGIHRHGRGGQVPRGFAVSIQARLHDDFQEVFPGVRHIGGAGARVRVGIDQLPCGDLERGGYDQVARPDTQQAPTEAGLLAHGLQGVTEGTTVERGAGSAEVRVVPVKQRCVVLVHRRIGDHRVIQRVQLRGERGAAGLGHQAAHHFHLAVQEHLAGQGDAQAVGGRCVALALVADLAVLHFLVLADQRERWDIALHGMARFEVGRRGRAGPLVRALGLREDRGGQDVGSVEGDIGQIGARLREPATGAAHGPGAIRPGEQLVRMARVSTAALRVSSVTLE